METENKPLAAFIAENKISLSACVAVNDNPNMDADAKAKMYHYKMTLTRRADGRKSQFTTFFSVGHGWTREPNAEDLLDCLASDASTVENARSFEEWADELGYNTDSRTAEKTFKTIEKQAASLKRFLGEDAYKELLWNVERQ